MKKIIGLTIVFMLSVGALFAQSKRDKGGRTTQAMEYTCPMHPDVTSDKPGKCPKCGMTLVEKKPAAGKKGDSMKKDTSMKSMKM